MRWFFLIGFSCSLLSIQAQNWQQISDYPSNGVDDGTSFVIGDKAYCGSGIVDWFVSQSDFYVFDLITEQWSPIASMPQGEERQYANGFASDSFGFVFGGYNGNFLNDLWRYDPQNDQWLEMTSLPDSGRGGAASFVIDSIAYIMGGKTDSSQAIQDVWAYNMNTDSWQRKNDMPFGSRWRSSATSYDSIGYLAFGKDDTLRYCSELYEYNPQTDSWTKLSDFPQGGRNYVKMHWINGELLAFGGEDSSGTFLNELWSYDIQNDRWEALNALPVVARRGGISFSTINGLYYVSGLIQHTGRTTESWKYLKPTSLEALNWNPQLSLYPNPTKNVLFVEHPNLVAAEKWSYELIDEKGSVIEQQKMKGKKTKVQIDQLPKGVYFLHLKSTEGMLIKKIVKH